MRHTKIRSYQIPFFIPNYIKGIIIICLVELIIPLILVIRDRNDFHQHSNVRPEVSLMNDQYSNYRVYKNAGVVSDDTQCNLIGKQVLTKYDGNALDVAIATAFCIGVVQPQASGIGADLFLVYKYGKNIEYSVDCRAQAPQNVDLKFYNHNFEKTSSGPSSIGTFLGIKCLYQAHQKYGRTKWKNLLIDSIELAKNYTVSKILAYRIQTHLSPYFDNKSQREKILHDYNLALFYNFQEHRGKVEGEIVKDGILSQTYEKLSQDPESFWTAGSKILGDILWDINHLGGWFVESDFTDYQIVESTKPLKNQMVNSGVEVITPPLPSGI